MDNVFKEVGYGVADGSCATFVINASAGRVRSELGARGCGNMPIAGVAELYADLGHPSSDDMKWDSKAIAGLVAAERDRIHGILDTAGINDASIMVHIAGPAYFMGPLERAIGEVHVVVVHAYYYTDISNDDQVQHFDGWVYA